MSIYKNKEIGDMSDQELIDTQYDFQWLLGNRENRLLDVKKRHKGFDFQTINPAFVKIQKEVETELALRKARG